MTVRENLNLKKMRGDLLYLPRRRTKRRLLLQVKEVSQLGRRNAFALLMQDVGDDESDSDDGVSDDSESGKFDSCGDINDESLNHHSIVSNEKQG